MQETHVVCHLGARWRTPGGINFLEPSTMACLIIISRFRHVIPQKSLILTKLKRVAHREPHDNATPILSEVLLLPATTRRHRTCALWTPAGWKNVWLCIQSHIVETEIHATYLTMLGRIELRRGNLKYFTILPCWSRRRRYAVSLRLCVRPCAWPCSCWRLCVHLDGSFFVLWSPRRVSGLLACYIVFLEKQRRGSEVWSSKLVSSPEVEYYMLIMLSFLKGILKQNLKISQKCWKCILSVQLHWKEVVTYQTFQQVVLFSTFLWACAKPFGQRELEAGASWLHHSAASRLAAIFQNVHVVIKLHSMHSFRGPSISDEFTSDDADHFNLTRNYSYEPPMPSNEEEQEAVDVPVRQSGPATWSNMQWQQ